MDYEKLYKEALERARTFLTNEVAADIFPELAGSKDERIRKAIEYAIGQSTHSDGTLINGVSSEEALAWLERQGEQKPYGQRQECVDCQFNYAGECKGSCTMKRSEQKFTDKVERSLLSGSEEDEESLLDLIKFIENWKAKGKDSTAKLALWTSDEQKCDRLLTFLKSLRPQNDAFIEKAENFLEMLGYGFTITDNITNANYDKEQLIADFRNYIK